MISISPVNSIRDAAKILRVSHQKIYDEINSGRLHTFKIGRRRFISGNAMEKYIQAREDEAA